MPSRPSKARKFTAGRSTKKSRRLPGKAGQLFEADDDEEDSWLDLSSSYMPVSRSRASTSGRVITVPIPSWRDVKTAARRVLTAIGRGGRSTAGYAALPLQRAGDFGWRIANQETPPSAESEPKQLQQRISNLKFIASIIAYTLLALLITINVSISLAFLYYPLKLPEPKLMLNHSRLAVMIERRDQPHLIPILHNFLTHVDWEWPFLVYYGRDNLHALNTSRLLQPFQDSGKLRLAPIIDEDEIHDGPTLSKYLTQPRFWEDLPHEAETLLFFQADSVLCSNSLGTINDFLGFDVHEGGYDWMGAPWDWRKYPSAPYGGNGGFSIRRKSVMLNVTRAFKDWTHQPEDTWFAERIALTTGRFPTIDRAMEFSFENPPYEIRGADWIYRPLGMHIGHGEEWPTCRDQDAGTTSKLLAWCPEFDLEPPTLSRPPNSNTSSRSTPGGGTRGEGSPPAPRGQRASTHSIGVSYAYGAPLVDSPNHHRSSSHATNQHDDGASVASGSTALSDSGAGRATQEPAAVRYARLKQRQKDTGSPFPQPYSQPGPAYVPLPAQPAPKPIGGIGMSSAVQNTSVNIATAFREAVRDGGKVVKGREGVRERAEATEQYADEDDEDEDAHEGVKETHGGAAAADGSSKKRKKRHSMKDATFKPGAEPSDSEESDELGEVTARSKAKRPKTTSGTESPETQTHAQFPMAGSSARKSLVASGSSRRKSGDPTYRPNATSEIESSESDSDDNQLRRRRKSKGRTSGGADAIPRGIMIGQVWMGTKKRKGKKGKRSTGVDGEGEEEDEEDGENGTGSGSGDQQAQNQDDLGGEDSYYPPSQNDTAPQASTSFFLRPRSPPRNGEHDADPAFAAFDRSIASSQADESGVRGRSYSYSEEERIVAALEQQKKSRSSKANGAPAASSGSKKKNRLPGPPPRKSHLNGVPEESNIGSEVWDQLVSWFESVRKTVTDPSLDWGKVARAAAMVTAALAVVLAVLLSRSSSTPIVPPTQPLQGKPWYRHLPFVSSSPKSTYVPPNAPPDSLSELVDRLTVLEDALGQLSSLSTSERTAAKKDRTTLYKLSDHVLELESGFEQERKKVAHALAGAEASTSKDSKDLQKEVKAVKGDLDDLVARVQTLSMDHRADAIELRTLEKSVHTVGKDIASLGVKVAQVSDDLQKGLEADRIAKIALEAIEQHLPSKLAVKMGPKGKLEIDPMFWKHLRDAFVEKGEVDSLVDGKVAHAVASRPVGKGDSKSAPPPPPIVKQPTWQEFLVANEAALRSWISSDISARAGSDAIVTKRAFLDLLHREIKSLKVDFEQKANENVEKIGQELLNKVAKQEQMRKDREGTASSSYKPVTIKSPDGQNVTALIGSLVDSALVRYSKDVLARPDFALATAGARVIPSLTSATYEAKPAGLAARALGWATGSGTTTLGHPPVTALLPQNSLGWCWPFAGSQGQLGVLLSRRVVPSDVTLEHASVDVSLDGEVTSAPREFEVWGVVESQEDVERLAAYRTEQQVARQRAFEATGELDDAELSASLPPSPNHILLAAGSYDVTLPTHVQTFPVTAAARQLEIPVGIVVFKFLSNHGDSHYTCLYRVRVSGTAVTSP